MALLSNKPYEREYLGEGYEGLAAQGALQGPWAALESQWRPNWANIGNRETQAQLFGYGGPGAMKLGNRAGRDTLANMEQWSPNQYGLLNMLSNQAQSELADPYRLAPGEVRELTQASMANPALASFGPQPRDAYAAYANLGLAANERAGQRRQFAQQAMEAENMYRTQPALNTRNAVMGSGMAKPVGPGLINPWNKEAQDVENTNFNAEASSAAAMSNFGMSMVPGPDDY